MPYGENKIEKICKNTNKQANKPTNRNQSISSRTQRARNFQPCVTRIKRGRIARQSRSGTEY